MRQNDNHLFDFLELDPLAHGGETLWKACVPTTIVGWQGEAVIRIPFQKQAVTTGVEPDAASIRVFHDLRLRAYGDKILRISIGFGQRHRDHSPMLELDPELELRQLSVDQTGKQWTVKDPDGVTRAMINPAPPEIDHWSDLLPAPQETFDITFYPDAQTPVKISAYDQFFPSRLDAMALAYVTKEGESDRAAISFNAEPDEKFAGTGERFTKMDLSGRTLHMKNQDGQGVNNRRAYKNVPFYLSSERYGMFLHSSAYSKFSLADHSTRSVQLLVQEPALDIFLIAGKDPEEILFHYRQITGFPRLPPLWSFGIWMSRMTYVSADEVMAICDRLRAEDFPCDVIHLDTGWFNTDWLCEWKFNSERFPDPEGFISRLREKGYRVSLWQLPYIASGALQHEEAFEKYYIGHLNERTAHAGSNFSTLDYAGTIDFTNPEAVQWYQGLLKDLLDKGVACIKTDFGEEIHMNATYYLMEPELLNNLYALLYQKAAYEITKEVSGDGIIWGRAGWAGCQRYPLHWGGDAAASWDGMAGALKGGLHLGLSGFAFWSHDVPGFHGVPDFMNAVIPDDLYVRWTQFGVFTSHLRYHGTSKREPYHFPAIADAIRKWWKLRYALIPYILKESREATRTGYPVLRALIFHHPDDRICWHIDDQYYFGEDILVAPIMNSQNQRAVYLPAGKWVNLFDGKVTHGPVWLERFDAGWEAMPVWVKYGAELPLYPGHVNCTDDMELSAAYPLTIGNDFKGIWYHVL